AARGCEGGLVGEVAQVGADETGGLRRDLVEVDVGREWDVLRVDAQDRGAATAVRRMHVDAPVEAPRSQQRLVEHVSAVRGRKDDDAHARVEPVHLGEDLVQRLLLLVVAPDPDRGRAAPTNGVELVDEDDCGRRGACLLEEVRTRDAPTPTMASTNSEAAMLKNGTFASPATARASSVLPVPGAPIRSTPFGMVPPRRVYFCGSR